MKWAITPSIIARSQAELEERIHKLNPLKPLHLHLDIMDGTFVKRTSLEFSFIVPPPYTSEAHLMVRNPKGWLVKNHAQIDSFIVHYESETHLHECIKLAKHYKKKIGVALNPETNNEDVTQYLKLIDKVLIMTVHPGKYGSPFLPEMLEKIKHIRKLAPKLNIEVDGGITPETIKACRDAGANQFVIGSFLQNAKNVKDAWNKATYSLK
ncbi:MAG: ribulose-phosphate 3-epimerase [Nanoarchaeota archaeon]